MYFSISRAEIIDCSGLRLAESLSCPQRISILTAHLPLNPAVLSCWHYNHFHANKLCYRKHRIRTSLQEQVGTAGGTGEITFGYTKLSTKNSKRDRRVIRMLNSMLSKWALSCSFVFKISCTRPFSSCSSLYFNCGQIIGKACLVHLSHSF